MLPRVGIRAEICNVLEYHRPQRHIYGLDDRGDVLPEVIRLYGLILSPGCLVSRKKAPKAGLMLVHEATHEFVNRTVAPTQICFGKAGQGVEKSTANERSTLLFFSVAEATFAILPNDGPDPPLKKVRIPVL